MRGLRNRNEAVEAYIEGVKKGIEIMKNDKEYTEEEFKKEVMESFEDYYDR